MKETIAKINKTNICYFDNINKIDKTLSKFIKEAKRRKLKSIKLEMKNKLQQTMQKYKVS